MLLKKKIQLDGFIAIIMIAALCYCFQNYNISNVIKGCDVKDGRGANETIIVEINAAQGSSGVYFLPADSTVKTILAAANIDISAINNKQKIDSPVGNGTLVKIGKDQKVTLGAINTAKRVILNIPIDLNNATADDLVKVPGIGQKQAFQIVEHRNKFGKYLEINDLMLISGIKEKKVASFKKYLTIDVKTDK